MKIGIVISQIDPETVWNAFRFANFSLGKKHEVRVRKWSEFCLRGVEAPARLSEKAPPSDSF